MRIVRVHLNFDIFIKNILEWLLVKVVTLFFVYSGIVPIFAKSYND